MWISISGESMDEKLKEKSTKKERRKGMG